MLLSFAFFMAMALTLFFANNDLGSENIKELISGSKD